MKELTNQKLKVEILWWVFTAVLTIVVFVPIWLKVPHYPFFYQNTILIVAFVTFSRYIFLLPTTLISRQKWIKAFIIACSVILFFVMTTALSDFHNFLEEQGLQTLVDHLHVREQNQIMQYMKSEMIFFGVGAIIAGVILPFRMLISIWRVRNRGTI
jgi:flagellar biosynthesis/type III secretory pathway M-ring protein FliF/YscJ